MSPIINAAGLALLEQYEGKRYKAYLDAGGVWTNGTGHTGRDVFPGQVIDEATRIRWRDEDLGKACAAVVGGLAKGVRLNENELAALVVFTFNVGAENFAISSVRRLINAGNKPAAARALLLWDKARVKGKLVALPGLARRRAAEAHLLLTPPVAATAPAAASQPVAPASVPVTVPALAPEASQAQSGANGNSPVAIAEAAQRALAELLPVKQGLSDLGLSTEWIGYGLLGVVAVSLVTLAAGHFRAVRRAAV